MSIEELRFEVLRLGLDDRAYLAAELLDSLDTMSEAEVESLWLGEAIRRDQALDQGVAQAFPADDVLARSRARRE